MSPSKPVSSALLSLLFLAANLSSCAQGPSPSAPPSVPQKDLSAAIPSVPGVISVISYFISAGDSALARSTSSAFFSGDFYVLSLSAQKGCAFAESPGSLDPDPQHRFIRLEEGLDLKPESIPAVFCDDQLVTISIIEGPTRVPAYAVDFNALMESSSLSLSIVNESLGKGISLILDRQSVTSYGISTQDTYVVPATVDVQALAFFQECIDDETGIPYALANAISLQIVSGAVIATPL